MDWELKIFDPLKNYLYSITPSTPSLGIRGGFKWQKFRDGNCIQLQFECKGVIGVVSGQSKSLGYGQLVQFWAGGTAQFFGLITDCPNANNLNSTTVFVVGLAEFFKRRINRDLNYPSGTNPAVETIADSIASVLPPQITIGTIQTGLGNLDVYVSKYRFVEENLTDLATLAAVSGEAVTYGVDALGTFFFKQPSTSVLTIPGDALVEYSATSDDTELCTAAYVVGTVGDEAVGLYYEDPAAVALYGRHERAFALSNLSISGIDHSVVQNRGSLYLYPTPSMSPSMDQIIDALGDSKTDTYVRIQGTTYTNIDPSPHWGVFLDNMFQDATPPYSLVYVDAESLTTSGLFLVLRSGSYIAKEISLGTAFRGFIEIPGNIGGRQIGVASKHNGGGETFNFIVRELRAYQAASNWVDMAKTAIHLPIQNPKTFTAREVLLSALPNAVFNGENIVVDTYDYTMDNKTGVQTVINTGSPLSLETKLLKKLAAQTN